MSEDFAVPEPSKKASPGLPFSGASEGVPSEPTAVPVPEVPKEESIDPSNLAGDSSALEEEAAKLEPSEKKNLFTEEELDKFWDATLANEPYTESVSFGKGSRKISVTFKTKGTSDLNEISEYMEEESITMKDRWNLVQGQYLLAASLHAYNRKILPNTPTDTRSVIQLKRDFIEKLPAHVAGSLMISLRKFDQKIAAMQQEVFSEDF